MPYDESMSFQPAVTNAQPRINRLTGGCILLFILPFILIGLYMIIDGARGLAGGYPPSQSLGPMIFGVFFGGIPLLIAFVLVTGQRAAAQRSLLQAQNPDRPWVYRQEWVNGLIPDKNASAPWFLLVFSIIFTALSVPGFYAFRNDIANQKMGALVALLFPLVGLALFVSAIYKVMRWHKFGVSRCRLDHIPIEPGHPFRAQIETQVPQTPPNGFKLQLTCVERITTGSGKNRSTHETVLWQDEQVVREGVAIPTPVGVRIPVSFTVPADAEPTDERNRNDEFVWRLDVTADEPGIDYAAKFELPVFNTANAPHTAIHFAGPQLTDVSSWQPAADSLISIVPLPTGEEIRVATHAHLGETLGLGIFTLMWFGIVALLIRLHAGVFFPLVFAGFGLLLLWGLFDFTVGRSTIRAGRDGVFIRRTWLGLGKPRMIPAQELAAAGTSVGASAGRTSYFDVRLRLKNGSQVVAAKYVRSRLDAEALAAKILNDCGVEPPAV